MSINPHPPSQPSGQIFHVSSVAIVTCGLDVSSTFILTYTTAYYSMIKKKGRLLGDPLPQSPSEKRNYIQLLENHGCFIQKQIQINSAWTHEQVSGQVRGWFPHVFAYLDSRRRELSTTSDNSQPDWLLLASNQGKLELSSVSLASGSTLFCFKGRPKSGVSNSNLWFGTCPVHHKHQQLFIFRNSDSKPCPATHF